MRLSLNRVYLGDDYTIGRFSVNSKYFCDTLEDTTRDHNRDGDLDDPGEGKVYGETSIPYGTYNVVLTYSNRSKKVLPLLVDVPHFTGIRIHAGNFMSFHNRLNNSNNYLWLVG